MRSILTPGVSSGTRIIDCCLCFGGGGIGLAHEDGDFAARIAGAGGPPLAAVDDVLVAVADDAGLDVGGVGGGHVRLGHGEAGADFAFEQRLQPALLLFRRAVARDALPCCRCRGRSS